MDRIECGAGGRALWVHTGSRRHLVVTDVVVVALDLVGALGAEIVAVLGPAASGVRVDEILLPGILELLLLEGIPNSQALRLADLTPDKLSIDVRLAEEFDNPISQ